MNPVFSPDIAIDLGSRSVRVHVRGRGGIVSQPPLLATCAHTGKMLAAGESAAEMRRRALPWVRFERPFEAGIPLDTEPAARLLRRLVRIAQGRRPYLVKPRLAVAVPTTLTDVQERAVREVLYSIGTRQAYLVPTPMAAALGADLPVDGSQATMVVDVGATATSVAVLACGGLICAHHSRAGGNDLSKAIAALVRRRDGLLIAEQTAEEAKLSVGALRPRGRQRSRRIVVHGRQLATGLPGTTVLSAVDVERAVAGPLEELIATVRTALALCPPELSADIIPTGMLLTGGGARLKGLPAVLREATGLPVRIAEDSEDAVINGVARYLEIMPASLRRARAGSPRLVWPGARPAWLPAS
ncbi:rod shape-determining protein [Actinomadura rupiterrae]|uniref:rod shape-determining protein n=1 Tax=Actinomadura rupiterrae TaxID=559627 RepID=UPI0020A2ED18|nr:rod shape-determining protein [Actinomadura rupiterrae]MCP2339344.1 rod shape-determining protein MreB [Actinomadura rupiterrae]